MEQYFTVSMVIHTVTMETVKYCSPGVFSYTAFFAVLATLFLYLLSQMCMSQGGPSKTAQYHRSCDDLVCTQTLLPGSATAKRHMHACIEQFSIGGSSTYCVYSVYNYSGVFGLKRTSLFCLLNNRKMGVV